MIPKKLPSRDRKGAVTNPRISTPAILAILSLLAVATDCGQKRPDLPAHYAFLGFENLSGDPSLDWLSRGVSEFLSRSLAGNMDSTTQGATPGAGGGDVLSPDAVARSNQSLGPRAAGSPGASSARAAALIAGANHIVSGYVEHTAAGIRITATEEDVATHQTVRTLAATAPAPFDALSLLAREFSPHAGSPGTPNREAFQLYSTALRATSSDAPHLLENAVALDPGFGRAWVTLARTLAAQGDRAHAAEVIAKAREQKLAPIDRAWLDVEDASLNSDRSAGLEAMRKLSAADPADVGLARTLATTETNAGNFAQAAVVWKRLTVRLPDDADSWNQLAYTLCWSGDYTAALAAVHEYARARPNDVNPLDSEGDIHFWFGKFAEASASYAAAAAKAPAFLNGGEFYKNAWARLRLGDKAGADALFAKFREAREKSNDRSVVLFAADWLYQTGREKEGRALLETSEKGDAAQQAAIRAAIAAQLATWDLIAGDRAAANKEIAGGGNAGLTPGDLVVRFAAMPSTTASEWEARATHLLAAPQLAAIRPTALGYALILDGKKQAAIPSWQEVVRQTPATDFFSRGILAKLQAHGPDHNTPPDPANFNPFAVVLNKL